MRKNETVIEFWNNVYRHWLKVNQRLIKCYKVIVIIKLPPAFLSSIVFQGHF